MAQMKGFNGGRPHWNDSLAARPIWELLWFIIAVKTKKYVQIALVAVKKKKTN